MTIPDSNKEIKVIRRREYWYIIAILLLIFTIASIIGTVVWELGYYGLLLLPGMIVFYVSYGSITKSSMSEALYVCAIIFILMLLLVPAIKHARNQNKCNGANFNNVSPQNSPAVRCVTAG